MSDTAQELTVSSVNDVQQVDELPIRGLYLSCTSLSNMYPTGYDLSHFPSSNPNSCRFCHIHIFFFGLQIVNFHRKVPCHSTSYTIFDWCLCIEFGVWP